MQTLFIVSKSALEFGLSTIHQQGYIVGSPFAWCFVEDRSVAMSVQGEYVFSFSNNSVLVLSVP